MCGIIGAIGDLTPNDEKIVRTLLILDSLRGEDSTGLLSVSKYANPEIRIAKEVGDPFNLFNHKSYDKAMAGTHRLLLGHNRYATQGGVSKANAHPFEHKTLIGVHNGTLRNKHVLADAGDFKVDSDNLYHHIEKHGLSDALEKIDGAWALCWWHKEEKTFNILRNNERPLWVALSADDKGVSDGKRMYFASEAWMLRVACSKHGQQLIHLEEVDKDNHFKIPVEDGGKLGKITVKKAAGSFRPPVYQYQGNGYQSTNHSQQTRQVIPLQKKEDKAVDAEKKPLTNGPTVFESQFDRFYIKKTDVLFEILSSGVDDDGAKYITLFDPKEPYKETRFYPNDKKHLVWEMEDGECTADISYWVPSKRTPGAGYYKVYPTSVKIIVPQEGTVDAVAAAQAIADAKVLKEESEMTIPGPNGKPITRDFFQRYYPACAWCSDYLIFGEANKFSLSNECFCPQCAKNPDVVEMVKF